MIPSTCSLAICWDTAISVFVSSVATIYVLLSESISLSQSNWSNRHSVQFHISFFFCISIFQLILFSHLKEDSVSAMNVLLIWLPQSYIHTSNQGTHCEAELYANFSLIYSCLLFHFPLALLFQIKTSVPFVLHLSSQQVAESSTSHSREENRNEKLNSWAQRHSADVYCQTCKALKPRS